MRINLPERSKSYCLEGDEMLTELYIENIAVIEKTQIHFGAGLNIMTGETGAGKSIVIGAIGAILGQRVTKDMIRTGKESAFVSAVFTDLSETATRALLKAGCSTEDDGTLLIQREFHINGKSSCRINGRPATVSLLKEIGAHLMNIHGQHESYGLLSPDTHITYLDRIGDLGEEVKRYQEIYNKMKQIKERLDALTIDDAKKIQRMDLLRYQIEEIESAALQDGEFEELTERRMQYLNSEKIAEAVHRAKDGIDGTQEFTGALRILEDVGSFLESIAGCFPKVEGIWKRVQNEVYELEDCSLELGGFLEEAEYDPLELERIEERLDLIYKLKRKYGDNIEEILNYERDIKQELLEMESSEEEINQLQERLMIVEKEAHKLAEIISEKRQKTGESFAKTVKQELEFLNMPSITLVVSKQSCPLSPLGMDRVEFLISTNPGEPPKSLAKVASGGELSRIMLAIKNVLADKDDIDTLIFDEVDTGISGGAAQKVGLKLRAVSKNRQVICVTHLAQIATLSDEHLLIKKDIVEEKTYTEITPLDFTGRKYEIARIIGGIEITETTLKSAEEMIRLAEEK